MVLIIGIAIPPRPAPAISPLAASGRGNTSPGTCLDATVTSLQNSGIAGRGSLCIDDDGVHPTVRFIGLMPGLTYSAWLSCTTQVFADPPTSSGTIVWRGGDPDGPPRQLGEGIALSTGELEFRSTFSDLRFSDRAQLTLTLLQPAGL